MKTKRFTEEQIAFVLRQAENGTAVADVCQKLQISEQTFVRPKKKSTERIDGIVATVMGLGRTPLDEGECNPRVFLIPW